MHYFPCFFRSAIMAVRSSLVKFCTLSQNWQVRLSRALLVHDLFKLL